MTILWLPPIAEISALRANGNAVGLIEAFRRGAAEAGHPMRKRIPGRI